MARNQRNGQEIIHGWAGQGSEPNRKVTVAGEAGKAKVDGDKAESSQGTDDGAAACHS